MGRRPSHWTDEMTNAALEHLEANKGAMGLYIKDRNAALEDCTKCLKQRFPLQKVSVGQLNNKFYHLWERHRRPDLAKKGSLYLEGRSGLTSAYARDTLLQKSFKGGVSQTTGLVRAESTMQGGSSLVIQGNSNHRAKKLKRRQRSFTAARHSPSPASSAYADESRERYVSASTLQHLRMAIIIVSLGALSAVCHTTQSGSE